MMSLNFNPRTSCEVRQINSHVNDDEFDISIHAPRVRCDHENTRGVVTANTISIHAPRVRCDLDKTQNNYRFWYFNPRTSCEVRRSMHTPPSVACNFNPRTSCEVRLKPDFLLLWSCIFQSTHLV